MDDAPDQANPVLRGEDFDVSNDSFNVWL